jgi:cation transport ATPase
VAVVPGDTVLAGAVNGLGVLEVQVVHAVGTRQVDGWAKTIQAALFAKPSLQHAAERAAQYLSFIAVGGAVLALVLALGGGATAEAAWARTLATLLIACPCALTMAIPLGVSAALGRAARAGILVRDPAALERAGAAVEVVLDKTGTLTQGQLRRVGVDVLSEMPSNDIVAIARSLEVGQTHPIARALAHVDGEESVRMGLTTAVPGSGVQGRLEQPIAQLASGTLLRLGCADWIAKEGGTAIPALNDICLGTSVWLAAIAPDGESRWLGRLRFADVVRDDARQLVKNLRADGLQVRVLSGDSEAACHALASEVSLSAAQVRARCSPDDKRNDILRAQENGRAVIFVGDGLNDGMALAQAELGIATVEATESAKVAASAVLMDQRLGGIRALVHISRQTRRVVRQSLAWSALCNALLIPAAIAGVLTPMMSAVAMTLGTLSVIANTQRLRTTSAHVARGGDAL